MNQHKQQLINNILLKWSSEPEDFWDILIKLEEEKQLPSLSELVHSSQSKRLIIESISNKFPEFTFCSKYQIRANTEQICSEAVRQGNLEVLQYAHNIGCPLKAPPQAPPNSTLCDTAINMGKLNCLEYLLNKGCAWGQYSAKNAASRGLKFLKYVRENGCPWDESVCAKIAKKGVLRSLVYAHENGCPWDKGTCEQAALKGNLKCLKYAHENGCPWDEGTCANAALKGRLECLKYAHENGCSWDKETCSNAAKNGHLDCLRYAHENGCPWDKETFFQALENNQLECMQYAYENGCSITETAWHDWHYNRYNVSEDFMVKYIHECGFKISAHWTLPDCIGKHIEGHPCYSCMLEKNKQLVKKQEVLRILMMDKLKTLYRMPIDYLNQKAVYYEQFGQNWDSDPKQFLLMSQQTFPHQYPVREVKPKIKRSKFNLYGIMEE